MFAKSGAGVFQNAVSDPRSAARMRVRQRRRSESSNRRPEHRKPLSATAKSGTSSKTHSKASHAGINFDVDIGDDAALACGAIECFDHVEAVNHRHEVSVDAGIRCPPQKPARQRIGLVIPAFLSATPSSERHAQTSRCLPLPGAAHITTRHAEALAFTTDITFTSAQTRSLTI